MTKLILITGLLLTSACQQEEGAKVRSLDNFTRSDGADLTINKCGVDLTPARVKALSAADKKKLKRFHVDSAASGYMTAGAFLAVPKPIQTLFFAADGAVRVVRDANKYCSTAGMSEAQKDFAGELTGNIDACWDIAGNHMEVIVKDNQVAVHYTLVRTFGYLYSQFFGRRISRLKNAAQIGALATQEAERFARQRRKISDALVLDAASGPTDARDRIRAFADRDAENFGDFAIAEAIDSYYCSVATRATMAARFPATYAAFTTGDLALTKDLGEPFEP